MGLAMETKRKISAVTAQRCRAADRKGKTAILDEFTATTGYNRKYALHILVNWDKTHLVILDGQTAGLKAGRSKQKRKPGGGRPKVYTDEAIAVLEKIWAFDGRPCGTILAVKLRQQMPFFITDTDFGPIISPEIASALTAISPRQIERRLEKARKQHALSGISTTKHGDLLKNQVPVRVYFSWDERKPGFFEIDTVAHCGNCASGHYCRSLTVTDVFSGWTELRSLLNSAHRWVKEAVQDIKNSLPFPMLGIDSDNGGEFINHQLINWCIEHHITFTRGRPYRKNDNCFVEQKNGDRVRKTVGYFRFDTEAEQAALAEVYRFTNPLTNFWNPSIKIIAKQKLLNGRYKKSMTCPRPRRNGSV